MFKEERTCLSVVVDECVSFWGIENDFLNFFGLLFFIIVGQCDHQAVGLKK